jgi:hypothetical protein
LWEWPEKRGGGRVGRVLDGNTLGYARKREATASPLSPFPCGTLLHEIGRVELGHAAEADFTDGELTPRSISEAKAESGALICAESLVMDGVD